MDHRTLWLLLTSLFSSVLLSGGVELTFKLPNNAKQCFYQEIDKNVTASLEFQVVTGGQYDIDVSLEAPDKEILYRQFRTQFDSHVFTAPQKGDYKICFGNEFSAFSDKYVYMDLQVGEEPPLPGLEEHVTVMTQLETSIVDIHQNLEKVVEYQTSHRLRETQGRKRAEDLNERVLWWSIMETAAILIVTIGQVMVLKNFFTERKSYQRL